MQTNKTLADFFSEHASSSKFIYEIETGKKKNHTLILNNARQLSSNVLVKPNIAENPEKEFCLAQFFYRS